jgi:hypothetical protein
MFFCLLHIQCVGFSTDGSKFVSDCVSGLGHAQIGYNLGRSRLHCPRPLELRVSQSWNKKGLASGKKLRPAVHPSSRAGSPAAKGTAGSLTHCPCAALLHSPGAPLQPAATSGKAARAPGHAASTSRTLAGALLPEPPRRQ